MFNVRMQIEENLFKELGNLQTAIYNQGEYLAAV